MNNIRIGTRLGAAFAFILLLLVIVAFTGFTRIQSLGEMADTLAGSRYQKAWLQPICVIIQLTLAGWSVTLSWRMHLTGRQSLKKIMTGYMIKLPLLLIRSTPCSRHLKAGS